jgi:hypothetical protein
MKQQIILHKEIIRLKILPLKTVKLLFQLKLKSQKTEKINTRCKLNSTIKLGTWVNVNVSSQIKL